jgi:hypothetical protein
MAKYYALPEKVALRYGFVRLRRILQMTRHETRFSYDEYTKDRIEALLVGTEKISHFVQRAVEEKLNREEARRSKGRKERLEDKAYISSLLSEIEMDNLLNVTSETWPIPSDKR